MKNAKRIVCLGIALIVLLLPCMFLGYIANADSSMSEILIEDDFTNWDNVFEKSAGWQLDLGNSVAGTGKMITKNNNDNVQYITYKSDENIGALEVTAYEVFTTTNLSQKLNVYLSADGKKFEKAEVTFTSPQQLNGTSWYKLTGNVSVSDVNEYKYAKIELAVLNTDECWYAGIGHIKILSRSTQEDEKESSPNLCVNCFRHNMQEAA